MKKCSDCNIEMINNAEVTGQHPFELGSDGRSDLYISYVDGKVELKGLFGKVRTEDNYCEYSIKARVCPKCGKVELYIDFNEESE